MKTESVVAAPVAMPMAAPEEALVYVPENAASSSNTAIMVLFSDTDVPVWPVDAGLKDNAVHSAGESIPTDVEVDSTESQKRRQHLPASRSRKFYWGILVLNRPC